MDAAPVPAMRLQRVRVFIDSTVSRPFDPPSTGKIAVKVINHYGDEVLKVYATGATP